MNGAKTDERNYYAESYIALIEAIDECRKRLFNYL